MDYTMMLDAHIAAKADLTVAVLNVTLAEASRFGIMNVDENMLIKEFVEKPAKPKSTLASMGIYIFDYKVLKQVLILDAKNENSEKDFGKNIIPYLLEKKKKLLAYRFDGYWKDVGTLSSLWSANMDLLSDQKAIDLYGNEDYKIFSEDTHSVPQYVGKLASVKDSIVNQGAIILGHVSHSVIFNEVLIEEDCQVTNSVVMPGAIIKRGAIIDHAIVPPDFVVTSERKIIGHDGIVLVSN
jgi:glucose-1-phosphate adenylyltransferase